MLDANAAIILANMETWAISSRIADYISKEKALVFCFLINEKEAALVKMLLLKVLSV